MRLPWSFSVSARTKILLSFSVLMATLGILLLLAVRDTVIPSLRLLYEAKGRALANTLSAQASRALAARDSGALDCVVREMRVADPDVAYAVVTGAEDRVLATTLGPSSSDSGTPAITATEDREAPVYEFGAALAGDTPGTARIALAKSGLDRAVARVRKAIFLAAMVVFSLGMILLILGAKVVLYPIRLLTDLADRIREGEYGVQVNIQGRDEIGRLVASVNAMSESLSAQRSSLREAQTRLRNRNSDLQSATRQLREEREKLRAVIEGMLEGVVFADPEGKVVFHNRSAELILGGPDRSLKGRSLSEILGAEIDDAVRGLTDAPPSDPGKRIPGPGDSAESFLSPVRDPGGRFLGVVLVCQDLTERIRLESEQQALLARLSHHDKLAALGSLAASVAHELNTPLGTVLLTAQMLGRKPADADRHEALGTIQEEVKRCRRIVANLLDFTRRSEGRRSHVDLADIVERAAGLTANEFRLRSLDLKWTTEPDLPPIQGDGDQLLQVLLNLLQNARDASRPGGAVRIDATRSGTRGVVVTVEDQGVGIDEEALPCIFEQFYTTKGAEDGTGLGLSICDQIVREHGGQIEVESEKGTGTTFRIRLPGGTE